MSRIERDAVCWSLARWRGPSSSWNELVLTELSQRNRRDRVRKGSSRDGLNLCDAVNGDGSADVGPPTYRYRVTIVEVSDRRLAEIRSALSDEDGDRTATQVHDKLARPSPCQA